MDIIETPIVPFTKQYVFKSPSQIFVCPVNQVGVMGSGLAKAFKQVFPGLEKYYIQLCKNKEMTIFAVWNTSIKIGYIKKNCGIILIPTKNHWKDKSNLDEIQWQLSLVSDSLEQVNKNKKNIKIWMPLLGAGLGELDPTKVRNLTIEIFSNINCSGILSLASLHKEW